MMSSASEHGPDTDLDEDGKPKRRGWFRHRHSVDSLFTETSYYDWNNPFTFYSLMMAPTFFLINWLMEHNLLAGQVFCDKCDNGLATLVQRPEKLDGYSWRCRKGGQDFERNIRRHSYFDTFRLPLADVINFIKQYLDGHTLKKAAGLTNINYKSTAVDWASYIRDIFMQYVYDEVICARMMLSGVVEVDESLFGKRCKYHRGKPKTGIKVWIVGLIERRSGRMILYPVENRDEKTLLKIITRHVAPGSEIYTDGWGAYANIAGTGHGYKHFTVIHKYQYTKRYREVATGLIKNVHTNTIEGAWTHAKMHFKRIAGTSLKNFESHLAEVIFRNHMKGQNIYRAFFEYLTTMYNCVGPARTTVPKNLFDTWTQKEEPEEPLEEVAARQAQGKFELVAALDGNNYFSMQLGF